MRLQYLRYSLLIAVFAISFVFSIVLAIGVGEHLLGGNLQEAQAQLREWFTLPLIFVFSLFMMLFTFIGLNIMAKRIRDIGLPGWWVVLIFVLLEGIVSYYISQKVSSSLHTISFILLLLIPSNTFGRAIK